MAVNTSANLKRPRLFVFFSELMGEKICDAQGTQIGTILDLIANIDITYPQVTGVLMRLKNDRRIVTLPWQEISFAAENITLKNVKYELLKGYNHGELRLKEALLDKQVVDTDGAKIRRVNDLQFLIANGVLYLVHVDVGFHGLLRRVGLKRPFSFILRALFDYEMTDQLISWKFVQPISSPDLLRLTIAQNRLAQLHPADLADIIEELGIHQRSAVFNALDVETAAETLEETDPKVQVSIIEGLSTENASDIIEEMSLSEAADLLGDLSPEKAEGILNEMESDVAEDMKELLAHPEEMAGGLMTTAYPSFPPTRTAAEVLDHIRVEADDLDLIYYIYVVDENGHILGVVSLRDLLAAPPGRRISELMDTRVVFVNIKEKKGKIADDFFKYGIVAMPVVDDDERLEGVILFKNLLEVIATKLGR
jgi:CBS domain-containing protein/sporulation protein YlmC with PRC-barrel domain